ncbi:TetR/AcrR family transcriptional regulator [Leuconostoc gasicomitatum]|uniref:TetR/AcrR family transcriptional regulator n=1 Tax=Leuconostoc gasicomitatum TaxID=115778 RepID=UPI000BD45BE4|nr:TetR/AcrR family transcriptional regulator [Leuconostoc gasicomitatum]MBZ5944230.1 TetR/AcrR family transcriptional regulator [Leuconostoc gasicomitatum]MBZ5945545.1 TetR/AcrR family transcriptional regulator [Leuconostoc gasicomitatum]MBZ5951401.1 TetR/AcrR family transcriptional regulator [Leuconostoc gasicomitatum]MBZ5967052.1 TetR/AcrR family transcriptional regulator [Leuconostoc gasicomitatum]MBZ5972125.1 TetR/AcrR family transcriptional regulator [Leuconostoc gasicomitatum]
MNEIMPNKRRESKKAIIIAGAQKVFSTKGFLNVTMQDIIDACGISRGGIYLYFRATDDIFFETITQRSVRQFDDIREAVKNEPSFDQLIRVYLGEHKNRLISHINGAPSLLRAMYEYSFTHHADCDKRLKQKQTNATKATVRAILDLGVKQNKITCHDTKIIADNFMLLIEGMSIVALTGTLTAQQIDDQFHMFMQQLS